MTKKATRPRASGKKPTALAAAPAKPKTKAPARLKPAAAAAPARAPAKPQPSAIGRPKGAKTEKLVSETTTSRCRKCDSTDRTKYYGVKTMAHPGRDTDGQPYTHIVWRRTNCRSCGQARIDRSLENRKQ